MFRNKVSDRVNQRARSETYQFRITRDESSSQSCRVLKGKELNDFQRYLLDIEIPSNLRFDSLEIRDTSVTRVTNNF